VKFNSSQVIKSSWFFKRYREASVIKGDDEIFKEVVSKQTFNGASSKPELGARNEPVGEFTVTLVTLGS